MGGQAAVFLQLCACQAADGFPVARPGAETGAVRVADTVKPASPSRDQAWTQLPPTPELPAAMTRGVLPVPGANIFHAQAGSGEAVVFLHGGLGNSDYWGWQIPEISKRYRTVVIDTRGHGRSTFSSPAITFAIMASDVIAVMDRLGIGRATIVGWSDGAITGLTLALSRPERVGALFAFGANFYASGLIQGGARSPVFAAYTARAAREYQALSPQPGRYPELLRAMRTVWATEPNLTRAQLGSIRARTWIVDGEHDEIIRRDHTAALAAAIPGARLRIQPGVGHFAMIQNPGQFNGELLAFLAGR